MIDLIMPQHLPIVDGHIQLQMNGDLLDILGRPNFTCRDIAGLLRATGTSIPRKAEAEQAHTVLFLLNFYLRYGAGWADKATEEMQRLAATLTKEKT